MRLAIDTSTAKAVLALDTKDGIIERVFEPLATQRVIFAELANLLDPETLPLLEGIVVGLGPGSFTGLKIGVIAAKTLAWSREIPIVGVSSMDAVAAGTDAPSNPHSQLVVVFPSTRGEAYIRNYHYENQCWRPTGDIRDIPLRTEIVSKHIPDGPFIISGEAAETLVNVLPDGIPSSLADESVRYPRAKGIFNLAERRFESGETDDPLVLVPMYIRPSQPERLEKEGS